MELLNTLTMAQKALFVCLYNGQKGTEKQVSKILKVYSTPETMAAFWIPRIELLKKLIVENK